MDDAIGALKTHDVEREKKFAASVEAEKSKHDVLRLLARVWRMTAWHRELLSPKSEGVHETGSTSL